MKKILFTLVFALYGIVCNAQLFKTIKYYDKFDDEVKGRAKKDINYQNRLFNLRD